MLNLFYVGVEFKSSEASAINQSIFSAISFNKQGHLLNFWKVLLLFLSQFNKIQRLFEN